MTQRTQSGAADKFVQIVKTCWECNKGNLHVMNSMNKHGQPTNARAKCDNVKCKAEYEILVVK